MIMKSQPSKTIKSTIYQIDFYRDDYMDEFDDKHMW